ncbi:MAG TPA: aminopeptidase N, partial [Rhizobiales bacterium]|nr:aminopeptidase N [Hyphomicrobiales bacterium]
MSDSQASKAPETKKLADYTPSPWVVEDVFLDVRLHPERTRVISELHVTRNAKSDQPDAPLVLDGEELELVSLALNGQRLEESAYEKGERMLTLPSPPPEGFRLRIETLCNPKANTALSGLYLSNGVYCTQCEAEGFRRITYFLDRPDVLARYKVRLEAPGKEAAVLLSNGNLVDFGGTEDMRQFALWEDPFPKPSYLFAMVAGNLAAVEDRFITMSGREVVLRI